MEPSKLNELQIAQIKARMDRLAERNPEWEIRREKFASETEYYRRLFYYFIAQRLTLLYEDELFDRLVITDTSVTGKSEEKLDAYMVLERGAEIHLELFQFKFTEKFDKGISTTELFSFVQRMNTVFQHGDLAEPSALEAFQQVRDAFREATERNPRAVPRIHCYYVVNGQGVSEKDAGKVQEIRDTFKSDRQNYGFTFEAYGGLDIYQLVEHGRIPIQDEIVEVIADQKPAPLLHHFIDENPNAMPTRVLVGFVNVNQLTRLMDRYSNNELFEKNVRLFLGADKEVNRRIIETVTSDRNSWFGYMNNGVSITADRVQEMKPPGKGVVRVKLSNMQIINGCQTVNSLYRAKFDAATRDRFQGNSVVLVRIYQIEPKNSEFMEALIRATNSQNAIRTEDLMANDPVQIRLQDVLRDYRIGYERKEGEQMGSNGYKLVFSKEDGALAYLASFEGKGAKLWGSLGRAKLFAREEDYRSIFPLEIVNDESVAKTRGLELAAAHLILFGCRQKVLKPAKSGGKDRKAKLRKARYYLARIVFELAEDEIRKAISKVEKGSRATKEIDEFFNAIRDQVDNHFPKAAEMLDSAFTDFQKEHPGGDLDIALKNENFARLIDTRVKKIQ